MAAKSPYAGSASLSYSVALARRIKALRVKGRKFTRRAFYRWLEQRARNDIADLMLPLLQKTQETIGRPAASWTPSEKVFAEKFLLRMLRFPLYEASRGRGRPQRKKIVGAGLIRAEMQEMPVAPAKRGRRPSIPAERASWWCRMVFAVKMRRFAKLEGYHDIAHIENHIGNRNVSQGEIDRNIPTAWALRLCVDLVTETTGTPPDKGELAYVSRYYSRLRRRFPL